MEQPLHTIRAQQTSLLSPNRLVALGVSTAIVFGFGWALSTGLAGTLVEKVNDVIQVDVLKDKIEKKEPPPPPPKMETPPPPFVPPPDIVIQTEAPPPTNTITTQSQQKVAPRLSSPFTIGKPHQCMQEYPAISQRLGEQGTTVVGFTINTEGHVENVHIVTSSGSERLDNAALSCVGNWRYGPAKNDAGQPVAVPNQAKVLWNLK